MEYILNAALVFFTGLLVWATVKLANHTRALSKLTEALVSIERSRDERDAKEKLLSELRMGLAAAESVQAIRPNDFATNLAREDLFPKDDVNAIETLQAVSAHIEDPDTRVSLRALCSMFDNKRREKADYYPGKENLLNHLETIQNRIQWSIDKWRRTISGAG